MTRRRFYAAPDSFEIGRSSVTLSTEETRHLRDVLRLTAGDRARVFDGQGHEYDCTIREVRRDFARLSIDSPVSPTCAESPLALTLAMALLKGDKFDLVVQKSTELGVRAIVPVMTKLADVRLRDAADAQNKLTRWQRIALGAAKQSGRAVVPAVANPATLETLVESRPCGPEACLMFSERLGKPFTDALGERTETTAITALAGSEGGWTDEEINLVRAAGWSVITLGGRVLRAETAAITICAVLQHRFGDLK